MSSRSTRRAAAKRSKTVRQKHELRAYRVLKKYFAGERERIAAGLKERYGENWTGQVEADALRQLEKIEWWEERAPMEARVNADGDEMLVQTGPPQRILVRTTTDYLSLQFWAAEKRLLLRLLIPLLAESGAAGMAQGEDALRKMALGVDYTLADRQLSKWIRGHADKLATQLTDNTRKALSETISTWMMDGTDFNDLIRRTERIVGPKRAEIVAVTETTRAFAEGETALWKGADYIEGREWATAEDELVCPGCAGLDGQVAPLKGAFAGGVMNPPLHPRCRCSILPVVKELA